MRRGTTKETKGQVKKGIIGSAEEFREMIREKAREALYMIVEEEIEGLCGKAWHPRCGCRRAGSAPSSVYIHGQRQEIKRPRVREGDKEVELESWKLARDGKEWEETMMRAVLAGVPTRKVKKLKAGERIGESKSNLSRLWQRRAAGLVSEIQQGDLRGYDLAVMMVDAVVLSRELVVTVALGFDTCGNKKILGYRVGGSENQEVCVDLLRDLKKRGLKRPEGRTLLAVLDGADALKNAVKAEFPASIIQRCLVHKERNVRGYLAKKHHRELGERFERLRKAGGKEEAQRAVKSIREFLSDKNANALASLEEAGEELTALHSLGAAPSLNVSLLSTNAIENAFRNLRGHLGRVCRWRQETRQSDLWVASGLKMAEEGFRKIKGYKQMHWLIKALERHHQEINGLARAA